MNTWVFFRAGAGTLTELLEWGLAMRNMETKAHEDRLRLCCIQHARWVEGTL